MRVAIVRFAYPQYLADYERRFPHSSGDTYAEQKRQFDYDGFWWADSWTVALAPFGYEVSEFVMNAPALQRTWAREHGMEPPRVGWMLPILQCQLVEYRPEVVFVQSFLGFRGADVGFLHELRGLCPSIRAIVGWCASPPVNRTAFRVCDRMLSCVPEVVEELNRTGHRALRLNHAFDPRVLDRIDASNGRTVDVSFAGQVDEGQHYERADLLREVGRELPLHVYTDFGASDLVNFSWTMGAKVVYAGLRGLAKAGVSHSRLESLPVVGRVATWSRPPRYRPALVPRKRLRPAVYGLPMFQTLRDSRLAVNVHSSVSPRSASNLRLFEASGVGTCLVTDWKENLSEFFAVDEEVVSFRSTEECASKIRWLLDNPAECERIARAGQERVLREHTFAQRAPVLDRLFRSL
jgi:spore maturation protein CgeB